MSLEVVKKESSEQPKFIRYKIYEVRYNSRDCAPVKRVSAKIAALSFDDAFRKAKVLAAGQMLEFRDMEEEVLF